MFTQFNVMVGAFLGCLLWASVALAAQPTECRFSPAGATKINDPPGLAQALERLAAMARAKSHGDVAKEIADARRAVRTIPRYSPRSVEIILDVADRLSPHAISDAAERALIIGLLTRLRPIADQEREIDTNGLRVVLKARYRLHVLGDEGLGALDGIEERIKTADICQERRFFLLLELARHVGSRHDQPLAHARLVVLRRAADELSGVGRGGRPMKWQALLMLTIAAVDLEAFDLAETWLADTIREADFLKESGRASLAMVERMTRSMVNLPEYVESRRPGHLGFEANDD